MPRGGPPTYNYSLPPIYLAIPGTLITAAQHNTPLEDLASTFNSITPIVWGGTGANSAAGARAALDVPSVEEADAYPPGTIYGNTLSNNVGDPTNDIDIAAGVCRSSADDSNIDMVTALTKRLDASWSVGNNQGGLDTGSIANTTYFVYRIRRPDTGVVDVCFSASAVSPVVGGNIPAAYTQYRYIGAIIRVAGAILAFYQKGDQFLIDPVSVIDVSTLGTTATLFSVTAPIGITVDALIIGSTSNASGSALVLLSSPAQADTTPTAAVATTGTETTYTSSFQTTIRTNTSAQIRARSTRAGTRLAMGSLGWVDTRGRNA